MNKKLCLGILLPVVLTACLQSSNEDGNPNEKTGIINLDTSRLGMSGGFVDVDADGKMDFIAGAPEAKASAVKSGAALIHLDYESNKVATADSFLAGEGEGDFFGFSFANVGDVNADGIADYAIGAINAEGDAGISGAVYLYKGGEYPAKQLAKLNGENAFDKFGFAISSGDVNADGNSDVIVTAPHTFHEEFQAGAVYVFFGGASFDAKPDVIIKGDAVNASVGMAVTSGDVNGDDIADIIMDGHAKVFVYYGGSDLKARIEADPTPNVKIRSDSGAHGGSGFGYALAYTGDINGDGFGDIAVGNKRRSSPGFYDNAGTLYVFKGGDQLPAEYFEDNTDYRIVKVVGAGFDEQLASSIVAVDDVNGGGHPDLVVGARWANGGSSGDKLITGNVYLFYGEELNVEDPSADQTLELAHKAFPQEAGSAELGAFVAVNGHALISGMPGYNKHDGGLHVTELHSGSDVLVGNSSEGTVTNDAGTEHKH